MFWGELFVLDSAFPAQNDEIKVNIYSCVHDTRNTKARIIDQGKN